MNTRPRFERIINGTFFPRYDGGDIRQYEQRIEQHADELRRAGATHVLVNDAPVSILQVMDPENSYLRFTTYGHAPDKYVTSTWNEGIFHPSILEWNRQALLYQTRLARRYGLRCWIRCTEMTMMPESFFQRHPALRGPRVDNPACSTSPRFALCPMLPETQDHYRQLITNLLRLCPDIDELHIFTNDSGGGFCYSEHLYSGPNGPVHCRNVSPGKQAQTFCRVLLEAGRAINPEFRVVMTSGLSPREKEDFLDGAPAGVASSIYGAFAWGGGLEDRWQNMAVGPDIHRPEVRAAARAWARADMEARARAVTSRGGLAYASYNPDYYGGPSDAPRPFETHEVLMTYRQLGVRNIIGGPWGTKWHANGGIFVQALREGPEDTEAAVRQLAVAWVGEARADRLCEAWRLSERADREWPMPGHGGHAFYCSPWTMQMPIVPDESRLGPQDLDYFLTAVLRDEQKMKSHQGGVWRAPHYRDDIKRYVIGQLETVVLPADQAALAILAELLADPTLTAEQRECLEVQRREIGIHQCYMERVRNWFQASFHRCAGSTPYPGLPTLPEIIDQELATSQRWFEWEGGQGALDSPRQRLMRAHRNDPRQPVDLREFPYHEYLGLNHWPGAHLTETK